MIFLDSNVPMYLVGSEHQHKLDAQQALGRLIGERRRLTTSAEVFQEILHRYISIHQRERIQPAFDFLRGLVDDVLAVEESDVLAAKDLALARPGLSSRDALHIAVMQHHGIREILTFDRGFDGVPGVSRLP